MLLFQTTAIENRITDSCTLSLFFEKNGVSSVCSQRQLNMLTSAEALPLLENTYPSWVMPLDLQTRH